MKSKIKERKTPMFEKRTVVELSENQLTTVDGGSTSIIDYIVRTILHTMH